MHAPPWISRETYADPESCSASIASDLANVDLLSRPKLSPLPVASTVSGTWLLRRRSDFKAELCKRGGFVHTLDGRLKRH